MVDIFSRLDEFITVSFLLTAITVIFLILLLVGFLSVSIRFKEVIKTKIIEQKKEQVLPLIFLFIEGEIDIDDIAAYIAKSRANTSAYKQVLADLIEDLRGSYEKKLQQLLLVKPLYDYHIYGLDSFFTSRVLRSLYYFRKFNSESHLPLEKIKKHLSSKHLEVVHVAGNALMGSTKIKDRIEALEMLAKRDDHSELAFLELLNSFHREDLDQQFREEKTVVNLLQNDDISVSKKKIIVKVMPGFGYQGNAEILYKCLKKFLQNNPDSELIDIIIKVLAVFYYTESGPLIRTLAKENDNPKIRESCAFALGKFGSVKDEEVLFYLLKDKNRLVRFEAAKAYAENKKLDPHSILTLKQNELNNDHIVFSLIREREEKNPHL